MSERLHPGLTAALCAIGLAGVSIALGLLYRDQSLQERALAELSIAYQRPLDASDNDDILAAWDPGLWLGALVSGTAGVALLGAGGVVFLYDLPRLVRRRDPPRA